MRVIYRKIRHARYLYIKRNVEKVWSVRYTLRARYLSKNTGYSEETVCINVIYESTKQYKRAIVYQRHRSKDWRENPHYFYGQIQQKEKT